MWGTLFLAAIPQEDIFLGLNIRILRLFMPAAVAAGTWTVGNIGHETGDFKAGLIAAYAFYVFFWFCGMTDNVIVDTCSISSTIAFDEWSKKWRRNRRQPVSKVK
jgi:hypothetical protein